MLARLITAQNRRNWHPYAFITFCIFVGWMRGLLEFTLQGIPLYNSDMFNFIPFYILLGFLLTLLLSATSGASFQTVQKSLTMGLFLGLFPPVFDFVCFGNRSAFYGYYYIWNFYELPWLGYKPDFNFPAGETMTIWISIFFCVAYVFTVTRKPLRAALALVGAYAIFIFMGSFLPMLVAQFSGVPITMVADARSYDIGTLRALSFRIAYYQGLLALIVYLFLRRDLARHLLPRVLHLLPFGMLTVLGGILVKANGVSLTQATLLMFTVALAVAVQNDFFDAQQFPRSHGQVPVQKYDVQIVNALTLLCIMPIFFHNNRAAIAAAVAFVCGVLYNYPFYRARNYFPANLKCEGVWGLTSFLAGAALDPQAVSSPRVLFIAFLVFGGWSTVAVLKDLKDAETDHQEGVQTVFTIFMRRGYALVSVWNVIRLVLAMLVAIPVFLVFSALPLAGLAGLIILTMLLVASFWLRHYRLALRFQLVWVVIYLGFWQVIFYYSLIP